MMAAVLGAAGARDVLLGAPVYDAAGKKLGRVVGANPYDLHVARGVVFPTEYAVALEAVDRYEDGKLFLTLTAAQVLADG